MCFPAAALCQALGVQFAEKRAVSTADSQALAVPICLAARPSPVPAGGGSWAPGQAECLSSAPPNAEDGVLEPSRRGGFPGWLPCSVKQAWSQLGDLLHLAGAGWGN